MIWRFKMKMVRRVLLGAAAGLAGVAGAQAADLPVKAKPVQYVKICSLYGAGFYYMPGTDTCIKLGGYVRAEVNYNAGGSFTVPGTLILDNRNFRNQEWRTRAAITVDARSQTEYGTLRSYLFLSANSDESGSNNSGFPPVNNSAGPSGYVRLYAPTGFIQLAGFTAGKTDTFFAFNNGPYSNKTMYWGSTLGGSGVEVFAYTAQLGNGLSASISAENAGALRQGITGVAAAVGSGGYAAETWPNVVASLRVDQAWGSAQVMGAVHNVTAADVGGVHPSDKVGWAVGAGLKVNLPMLGNRDYAIGQLTYTEGALRYITAANGTGNLQTVASGNPVTATALGPLWDAVGVGGAAGSLDLTKAWTFTGGYEHFWNSQWKTSLYGEYGKIDYSTAASAALGYVSADWSLWQIGSRTVWTPVANLDLSVDVMYNNMNGVNTGVSATSNNINWVSGVFRVQRNFYP
jgi:hypothetical protein